MIVKNRPTGYIFKGYLLAAYKSIVSNAQAHKVTRNILLFYLLVIVIAPPTIVMGSFLAAPVPTARFFSFSVTPSIILSDYNSLVREEGDVLGDSVTTQIQQNPVFAYISAMLQRQAEGAVKVLRTVSPTVVSGIVLPIEVGHEPSMIFTDGAIPEAGYAIIKTGSNEVNIDFAKTYSTPPVVSVNINLEGVDNPDLVPKYGIYHVTIHGFKIKTAKAVSTNDLVFSWIALPTENQSITSK